MRAARGALRLQSCLRVARQFPPNTTSSHLRWSRALSIPAAPGSPLSGVVGRVREEWPDFVSLVRTTHVPDAPAAAGADAPPFAAEPVLMNSAPPTEPVSGEAVPPAELFSTAVETAAYFDPAAWAQFVMQTMHNVTGLPLWASIAATAVTLRFCMLPLTVRYMRYVNNMDALQPELTVRRQAMMEAMRLVQLPIYWAFFEGLRRLPSVYTEVYWHLDPSIILSIVCAHTLADLMQPEADNSRHFTRFMVNAVIFYVISNILSLSHPAVSCFFIPNILFSIWFEQLIKNRWLKNRLVPDVDLATIPGTKQHAQAMGNIKHPLIPDKLDSVAAAASRIRRNANLSDDAASTGKSVSR